MKKKLSLLLVLAILIPLFLPAQAAYRLPEVERIVYGHSGEGRELEAYRIGSGENVLVMGFAIHGYEDNFARDGECLVYSANQLITHLKSSTLPSAHDWTVYVLPCMNPDGLKSGWTNNGPGRCTTTYLDSSGKLITGKGIDMNRCFPTRFTAMTNARNFNSTRPMACKEAQAISAFIQSVKGKGANLLFDVHGWLQQTITASARIRSAVSAQFPNNTQSNNNGGAGYLISYAHSLGYEVCLLELPYGYYSYSQYVSGTCTRKIISLVDTLLQSEPLACADGHSYEIIDTPASCTQDGFHSRICTRCGEGSSSSEPALGHDLTDQWTVQSLPTASKPGLRTAVCSRCGGISQTIPSVFTDVKASAFYSDPLDFCYDRGFIKGTSATTFSPDQALSRAMLVTMLHRRAGEPEAGGSAPFEDLKENSYYADAVNWAYEAGVIEGTSETTFSPDDVVTREQAMAIFFRYVQHLGLDNQARQEITAPDGDELGQFAVTAAQWSVANSIITGDEHGLLHPRDGTTRAESVTILVRVADYVENVEIPDEALPEETLPEEPTQ